VTAEVVLLQTGRVVRRPVEGGSSHRSAGSAPDTVGRPGVGWTLCSPPPSDSFAPVGLLTFRSV